MKKRQKKRNKKSLPIKSLILPTILALVVVILYFLFSFIKKQLTVESVSCAFINQSSCPEEITTITETIVGTPLLFFDHQEHLISQGLSSKPVTIVSLTKEFPDKAFVTLQSETPFYSLIIDGEQLTVSKDGTLFLFNTSQATQVAVEAPGSVLVDQKLSSSFHHTISQIITTSQSLNLLLKNIRWLDNSTIELTMDERAEKFIIDSQEPTQQLHRLALVLESAEYETVTEAQKRELDLRFVMPVLRTAP